MKHGSPPLTFLAIILFTLTTTAARGDNSGIDGLDTAIAEENLFFDEIPSVFGASKYEQKVTDAPSRISIVTGHEIRRLGYRTLSDVLRSLPGFSTSNDRNYYYTGVRGFGIPGDYDTRLLQLVNGHRINDNVYGSLFNDHSLPVDLDLIERVEVIRGPSSSIYGSSAFLAVVNIITKEGRDIGGLEISASVDSLLAKEARISYGNRLANGVEILFSTSFADSEGKDRLYYPEFDNPSSNNGIAENGDGEDYQKFFARASFGGFSMEGAYSIREKAFPTAAFGTIFNAQENRTWDSKSYVDARYQSLLDNGIEFTARINYDLYWYKGNYLYDYGDPGDPYISLNKDLAEGQSWGGEIQWGKQLERHHLIVGVEYRDSFVEKQKNYDQDGVYLDTETDSNTWAVFAQDDFQLVDDLILNMGLRFDHYSSFGNTVNPRVALIWSPLPGSTIKILHGTAFRAPNAYEQYYTAEGWKPIADLGPETIETTELVLEQHFNSLRGVVSFYQNEIRDLVALTTDPADGLLTFVNQGNAIAKGIEFELEKRWMNGISGTVSYTHQDAKDGNTGERLVNYASNMVKFNVTVPIVGDLFGAVIEAQYEAGRLTLEGDKTDDRVLVNLSLFSEEWVTSLTASLSIYNLLNDEYADPASEEHLQDKIEQNGRTYRLRFIYAF